MNIVRLCPVSLIRKWHSAFVVLVPLGNRANDRLMSSRLGSKNERNDIIWFAVRCRRPTRRTPVQFPNDRADVHQFRGTTQLVVRSVMSFIILMVLWLLFDTIYFIGKRPDMGISVAFTDFCVSYTPWLQQKF